MCCWLERCKKNWGKPALPLPFLHYLVHTVPDYPWRVAFIPVADPVDPLALGAVVGGTWREQAAGTQRETKLEQGQDLFKDHLQRKRERGSNFVAIRPTTTLTHFMT